MSTGVAVDVVVLSLGGVDAHDAHDGHDGHASHHRGQQPELRFLAVRRTEPPHAGAWSLPGRIVGDDEDLDAAVPSVLADTADVPGLRHVEQLATFGAPARDPRGRIVSVSYLVLMARPAGVTGTARWLSAGDPPVGMAFDHDEILAAGVARLRSKLGYSNVAYGLLPDEFTLRELQDVYEAVVGDTLDKRNFRKKVLGLGLLAETAHVRRGPHRPAQLYRFAHPRLVTIDTAAIV